MNVLLYGNCQMDGLLYFLEKSSFGRTNSFNVFHNFRLILMEQSRDEFWKALNKAELVIYQPTSSLTCRDGYVIPDTNTLLVASPKRIAVGYAFNHGFFPIVKHGEWQTGDMVKLIAAGKYVGLVAPTMFQAYNANLLIFDCARRFAECLAEQWRREEDCDIPMADFILANFQSTRLFLCENHPTSAYYVELTGRVLEHGNIRYDGPIPVTDNDAGMPGEIPVHPAVVRELGLKYAASDSAHAFYRGWLEHYIREIQLLPADTRTIARATA